MRVTIADLMLSVFLILLALMLIALGAMPLVCGVYEGCNLGPPPLWAIVLGTIVQILGTFQLIVSVAGLRQEWRSLRVQRKRERT